MSITLKRPMFRKGGSASGGVGITSGLQSRKNYQVGGSSLNDYPYNIDIQEDEDGEDLSVNLSATANTNKNANVVNPSMDATREAYARQFGQNLQKQMMPSYRDQVLDFLTAFGATGATPGQYQTISDALSKTGKNFQAIFDPKVQAAKKAGTQGYIAALKGVDKENLLKYQKQARDLFNAEQMKANPKFKTLEDALAFVVTQEIYGKDKTKDIIESAAQKKPTFGTDPIAARAEAEIEYQISTNPEYAKKFGDGRFKGSIKNSLFQKDKTTGNYVLKNPQQKGTTEVNDVFVEPISKTLYYFDGKKLVPTK
jgi:hypothetical protein